MDAPTASDQTWDVVDEASFESFPASDPPGWGSYRAGPVGPRDRGLPDPGRDLLALEPFGVRYLVVHAGATRRARWIGEAIAARVRELGQIAELADLRCRGMPHPADYDAAIIGISVGFQLDRSIVRWLHHARPFLDAIPTAVFVVGGRRSSHRVHDHLHRIGWRPAVIATFPYDDLRHWLARLPCGTDRDDAVELASRFVTLVDQLRA